MPVSSGVRKRIRGFLDPDDEIQYVFPAEVQHGAGSVLGYTPCVFVVVSAKAITVLSTGFWSRKRPKSLVGKFPRNMMLGPVEDGTTAWFMFNGLAYEIEDEYVAVVNAADAEILRDAVKPEDPLPDL